MMKIRALAKLTVDPSRSPAEREATLREIRRIYYSTDEKDFPDQDILGTYMVHEYWDFHHLRLLADDEELERAAKEIAEAENTEVSTGDC